MSERTILLTGELGQVGWELRRTLAPLGRVVPVDVDDLDLTDPDAVRAAMRDLAPDLVVNPAAYTAVDRAESEPEAAAAINAVAPGVLGEEVRRLGGVLVHYSTDYVFDGENDGPYTEDAVPAPINVYGHTKLAGENAVRESGCDHLILRTSWVYGMRGRNFLRTVLRLATERDSLQIVDDQRGAPTWCRALAEATAQVLAVALRPGASGTPWGTYHATCAGSTTWYGFARAALLASGGDVTKLEAVATAAYPTEARRPRNSCLDNRRLFDAFGVRLPDWENALETCLGESATDT